MDKFGLTSADGWFLCSRLAEIADCNKFTPPTGTRQLCQTAEDRRGRTPVHYLRSGRSPANRAYCDPNKPEQASRSVSFALAVIRQRPRAYAELVMWDFVRYFQAGAASPSQSDAAITFAGAAA